MKQKVRFVAVVACALRIQKRIWIRSQWRKLRKTLRKNMLRETVRKHVRLVSLEIASAQAVQNLPVV